MAHLRLNQVVGNHGVEQLALHVHTVLFQHQQVVLQVLPDLLNQRILKHGLKFIHNGLGLGAVGRNGHVESLARPVSKRQAYQIGLYGVDGGGFGIKAKTHLRTQVLNQTGP